MQYKRLYHETLNSETTLLTCNFLSKLGHVEEAELFSKLHVSCMIILYLPHSAGNRTRDFYLNLILLIFLLGIDSIQKDVESYQGEYLFQKSIFVLRDTKLVISFDYLAMIYLRYNQ